MPPVGFEPIISTGERPKTYALDRAATGIGDLKYGRILVFAADFIWVYILSSDIMKQ
jgi:hypothetical protein